LLDLQNALQCSFDFREAHGKCVVVNQINGGNGRYNGASSVPRKSDPSPLKSDAGIPLADANSLLALSKTPTTGANSNINQTNQMVLNWLQALHVNANSTSNNNSNPNNVKEEYIAVDDEEMEATEASELVSTK